MRLPVSPHLLISSARRFYGWSPTDQSTLGQHHLSFRFLFIDQHTRRNVVDEIDRRNSHHRHRFFIPQMDNTAFDNFAGLRSETNGRG